MTDLTQAQLDWLAAHPQYGFPGRPKPGPRFYECGTLYADGRFDPMAPMKPVNLEPGCRLVGIPGDLYLAGDPGLNQEAISTPDNPRDIFAAVGGSSEP